MAHCVGVSYILQSLGNLPTRAPCLKDIVETIRVEIRKTLSSNSIEYLNEHEFFANSIVRKKIAWWHPSPHRGPVLRCRLTRSSRWGRAVSARVHVCTVLSYAVDRDDRLSLRWSSMVNFL